MKRFYPLLPVLFLIFWSCEDEVVEDTTPTEVTLWGVVYSIENTTEIDYDIFGGTMATEWTGWQAGDTIPREIALLTNLTHLKINLIAP